MASWLTHMPPVISRLASIDLTTTSIVRLKDIIGGTYSGSFPTSTELVTSNYTI
jgi:hypothetical protein